jgi:cell wall-associated NlpC family hydrolase
MSGSAGVAPPEVMEVVAGLVRDAQGRYGEPMIAVTAVPFGLVGHTATPDQKEQLVAALTAAWPQARARVLVLADRRARLQLRPGATFLDIWRRPRATGGAAAPERSTQLLPGDPPAQVVAFRTAALLVRAPGDAIGWVDRQADFTLEAASSPRSSPEDSAGGVGHGARWDVEVVLATALDHLGEPYLWGGTGGGGFDCSGLIWRAFLTAGVLLPKNSRRQRQLGTRVARRDVRRGDLVAAISRGPRRTSHVALALGPREVVHACSELGVVRREPLDDFLERYRILTIRRLSGARARAR